MKINKKIRKKRLKSKFLKGAIRLGDSTVTAKRKGWGSWIIYEKYFEEYDEVIKGFVHTKRWSLWFE